MKIGVDFGTSFSSAAFFVNGEVQPITFGNDQQFRTAVFFPDRYVDPSQFVLTAKHEHEIDSAIATQKSFYNSQMALYRARLESIDKGGMAGGYGRDGYSAAKKALLRERVAKPRKVSDEDIRQSTINMLRRRWVSMQRESIAQEGLDVRKANGIFGEDAIEALYNDEDGRIFQSPKSMLGYRLEPHHRDVVVGVISQVLAHIRNTASRQLNKEVTAVVLGRPVEFRGTVGSRDDQQTQDLLERAAKEAGFADVEFLREPSAAAYAYHMQSPHAHAALIIDIGGGTTDIAYAQVGGEVAQPVIHQVWGQGFGGTDVDVDLSISAAMPMFGKDDKHGLPLHAYRSAAQISALSLQRDFVKQDLARVIEPFKTRLKRLKEKGTTVRLNRDIEQLKIDLSGDNYASRELDYIEPELRVTADSNVLETSTRRFLKDFRALLQKVRAELSNAVPVVFMTGGMSRAPYVQACVCEVFAGSEVVMGDASLGVVAGLAQFAAAQGPGQPAPHTYEGADKGLSIEEIPCRD
ncbi:Hsp70 family protein [Pseudomonas viridiflava]|uniref:Heat-shock protein n=4 Tax=Pseudomonas TaxID=286 RepID=A0AA46W4Q8_PSEVI|nr:Hsp70 family protein [Pseudomonas viridiflava]UZA71706.1 heat-shock protein [Pseudomonas viridiflava]VVN20992.1 Chaperone protein HscA [Pseudomonas fluorescens]